MDAPPSQAFSTSLDSTTKIISGVVVVILAFAAIATQNAIVAGIGALLIALSFAYSPRGYTIQDRSITVKRLAGDIQIPLDGIQQVRRVTPDDLQGCVRLWGNGGLFGYTGLFQTSKLGKTTWYVTNRSNSVVIVTDSKTVLVSPDNVESLIEAIKVAVPVPPISSVTSIDSVPLRGPGFGRLIGAILGVGVGTVALAFVIFAISYNPGPPRYTLTPTSLTIQDRFYPVTIDAAAVGVGGIRIVDIATDRDWQPTARTNGFANSHYRSGWFRVMNGQKVRMYLAGGNRLALLPPRGDGVPVLLEVADPEPFIEEVRQEWGR